MNKVRVLLLGGCNNCEALITKLNDNVIKYIAIDADDNSSLADDVERLVNVTTYPIIILEQSPITTFLFKATDASELGLNFIDHHTNKLGCATVDAMVEFLQSLLK